VHGFAMVLLLSYRVVTGSQRSVWRSSCLSECLGTSHPSLIAQLWWDLRQGKKGGFLRCWVKMQLLGSWDAEPCSSCSVALTAHSRGH